MRRLRVLYPCCRRYISRAIILSGLPANVFEEYMIYVSPDYYPGPD